MPLSCTSPWACTGKAWISSHAEHWLRYFGIKPSGKYCLLSKWLVYFPNRGVSDYRQSQKDHHSARWADSSTQKISNSLFTTVCFYKAGPLSFSFSLLKTLMQLLPSLHGQPKTPGEIRVKKMRLQLHCYSCLLYHLQKSTFSSNQRQRWQPYNIPTYLHS